MNEYIRKHNLTFLTIVFLSSLVCTGIFYEYFSCAFVVLFSIIFCLELRKSKKLFWKWNATTIFVVSMCAMYLVTCLWAVDMGMAFIGFLKFLPVLLFVLVVLQNKNNAQNIVSILPYAVTILNVVSIVIYVLLPDSVFSVADRLAGFFQYPNTHALLLLVAELLIIGKNNRKVLDYIALVVLIAGILLTGSRTVFVLAAIANSVLLLKNSSKKIRIYGLLGLGIVIIGVVLYAAFFDNSGVLARFLRFSVTESTFVGRILYFVDALPTILKSPFGLGYMGYYYIQQSIQTGYYSVMFIHNDLLQILLDIGWVPFVLFVVAIVKTLKNKKIGFDRKVILTTILLHSCFDFNIQFVSMYFVLVLFMDLESGNEIVLKKELKTLQGIVLSLACLSLYCGISLVLAQAGKNEASLKLYPWNTQAQTNLLTQLEDINEAGEVADKILERNEYVTLAYSAKSRQAYSKGDFASVITYKNTLLEKAPFQYAEYEDYCYMLINGISLYTKARDIQSADICKKELLAIPGKLREAKERVSKLGTMIKDQPITELSEDINTYIERLEAAY